MERRKRRKFTPEFKADAVRLVTTGGKTIAEVTKQFDLIETSLRAWIKQAETDAGRGSSDALTTAERAELVELRKRVKRAEMERDILKKATAFFAKESA
jgi:transposase-like protein